MKQLCVARQDLFSVYCYKHTTSRNHLKAIGGRNSWTARFFVAVHNGFSQWMLGENFGRGCQAV